MTKTPYEQGYDGCESGDLAPEDNPYEPGTESYNDWVDGWCEADLVAFSELEATGEWED